MPNLQVITIYIDKYDLSSVEITLFLYCDDLKCMAIVFGPEQ